MGEMGLGDGADGMGLEGKKGLEEMMEPVY